MGDELSQLVAIGPTSGLQYAQLHPSMAIALEELELSTFATTDPVDLYDRESLTDLANEFPEGGVVGFDGADRTTPVAMGLGMRLHFDFSSPQHSINGLIDAAASASGDDPTGPWYYGTDIAVRPEYRRQGIGKELYDLRKGICVSLNLAGIVAGGMIPGYAEHKDAMSADEYINAVKGTQLYDATLSFQLENGFDAIGALADYMVDPSVNNSAALIVWHNPEYKQ